MFHSFDICRDIAEKMRSHSTVARIVEEQVKQGATFVTKWPDLTLASGLPGIACFYSAMDKAFPDEGWDDVAHEYLREIADQTTALGYEGYSLFLGLCGLCFAGQLCAKNGRYQQFITKLDTALIEEVEFAIQYIKTHNEDPNNYLPPHQYNLLHGLSGVVAYLILKNNDKRLQQLMKDCIETLLDLFSLKKQLEGISVPAWFLPHPDAQYTPPSWGGFPLSMLYGVTGVLSTLSLAAWNGYSSQRLYKTIEEISSWLRDVQLEGFSRKTWPYLLPFSLNDAKDSLLNVDLYIENWNVGRPAVALSLFLAGRAMQSKSLMKFAEDSFVALFDAESNWGSLSPSFSFGKAGLLVTTYRMAKLTDSGFLMRQVAAIEFDLKQAYHPSLPFGFQRLNKLEGQHLLWNDPGLLNGAIGVILALLLANGMLDDCLWNRAFFFV